MSYKYAHGLTVMRAQPFHIGHEKMVNQMLDECERVTLLLGSIQEHGTNRNPLSYSVRKKMIQNIYRQHPADYARLRIIGLYDINNPAEWAEYVLDFISETMPDLPKPDVYYAGSDYDAHWFRNAFNHIEIIDRVNPNFPFVTASMIRDMLKFKDTRWKNFVAPVNHVLLEDHFYTKKGVA